ncbi:ABC transporter substrate-binding protein [Palleronia caenipelagi]|uniref:Carbohydrate ABC transporter substrate-binding protein n=1 Tax=Palleronia caenipelagi TaxID=2489174 RepID=A0A547PKG2_9RHOB|nr:ABC transporter substrate-binding protein [Palleronia caenipelagi]TRD14638.1 carbohydrate ABC transporter substrate-binding protein [Palleronia caenipelagi]
MILTPLRPSRLALVIGLSAVPLTASAELLFPIGEGDFSWDSYEAFAAEHDYSGQELRVTGASTGDDGKRLENVWAYFAEATGATVEYSGSESFEQDIVVSSNAGSAPNIAAFPQPGLARDLAGRGLLTAPEGIGDWMAENYAAGSSWSDLATFVGADGSSQPYGIFFGTDVKSLVWYSPEAFEENGYEVPQSMEELKALTEQIAEDGGTPWCIGLGSGAATGWPATDWVEDLMLRTQPPEVYDQWVSNEMKFDDPRVIAAIEEFGWFAKNDAFVKGGASAVPGTDFRDSPLGLFELPPECYMHRQASFIPNFFPEDVSIGEEVDFFYFPSYADKDLGNPVLGSGGLMAITNDSEVARGFIEFLKTPIAHEVIMAQGQFLTPHKGVNRDMYRDDAQRALGEVLNNATTFRFDGSDLMPGEIGTAAFWTGMVDYVSGSDAETVAKDIQTRWDAIQ